MTRIAPMLRAIAESVQDRVLRGPVDAESVADRLRWIARCLRTGIATDPEAYAKGLDRLADELDRAPGWWRRVEGARTWLSTMADDARKGGGE